MTIIMIEAPDRCGKSSLAEHLRERHGYAVMHFGRPDGGDNRERAWFQRGSFDRTFRFLSSLRGQRVDMVCDRAHLGEYVYGSLYRSGSGVDPGYIFDLETAHGPMDHVALVLLVNKNFDELRRRDDGLGFDIGKIEDETELFEEAWSRSRLPRKLKIDATGLSLDQVIGEFHSRFGEQI